MNILILGASGLIGSNLFRYFKKYTNHKVFSTSRSNLLGISSTNFQLDIYNFEEVEKIISVCSPHVIINCIGITKHVDEIKFYDKSIYCNSLFPHLLHDLASSKAIRLIHISTDCIFSGLTGNYVESSRDISLDLYGLSKYLGEVSACGALTIRTSTIGHELSTRYGLLEWFLSQKKQCNGFSNAIFSGLPAIYLGKIIDEIIFDRPELSGVYHVASNPINKFDLLNLISEVYKFDIKIINKNDIKVDRSLNANKFFLASGFKPPSWEILINFMYEDYKKNVCK